MKISNILSGFKLKQHLIYLAMAIILAVLAYFGAYWALLLFLAYPQRFRRSYPIYFLAALLGVTWFWKWDQPLAGQPPIGIHTFEGYVSQVRRQIEGRQVAVVVLEGQRIYLTYLGDGPRILPGDRIRVQGELLKPSPQRVPHAFDFGDFLRGQHIGMTLLARDLDIIGGRFSIWRYQHLISDWVGERFPPLSAAYIQALFLGRRDGMDEEAQEAFSNLGIVHVFAISGMHVSLLSGLLAYGLKRLGVMEELAHYVILVFLGAFVFLAGGSPSIVRAATMSGLGLLNRRFKLGFSSLDIFSAVFLGNFLLAPYQIRQVGFIYSYWLAFVLLLSKEMLLGKKGWELYLFFPFLAQLGALPLTLFFNYEINLWSYAANLLLVPLVTGILIPLLLVAIALPVLSNVTEPLLEIFQRLGSWASNLFFRPWVSGAIGFDLVILLLVLVLLGCYLFERFQKAVVFLGTLAAMVFLIEVNRMNIYSRLTFLDVGQGDAMIVQSPIHSCTVVIDTGGQFFSGGRKRPIFSQTLEPFLLGEGVRKVDYLILTHGDFDHMGEARELMDRFLVKNVIVGVQDHEGYFQVVIDHAKSLGIPVLLADTLDELTCGNQHYTFLQPNRQAKDENDASLVKLLEINGVTALLTGDIGFEVEPYILRNLTSPVDIYKGAHHGSRFSNSLEFIKGVDPTVAVVHAGVDNRFGHPHQEWFDVMGAQGIKQFDTPTYGTVQFEINGRGDFQVRTWLKR